MYVTGYLGGVIVDQCCTVTGTPYRCSDCYVTVLGLWLLWCLYSPASSCLLYFLSCLEILSTKVWQTNGSSQDPELNRLAKALLKTVLKARADSTTKKYIGAFHRWASWEAERAELTVFLVEVPQFALYLQHLGETTKSRAAVEETVKAVSWAQHLAGQTEIARSGLIKSVVEGFQCQLACPKKRKEPVTVQMLQEIVASMDPESLSSVRLVTLCLIDFAAFLRFNEICQLRCCDVKIIGDKLEVFIKGSETNQFRQGNRVPIVCSGLFMCPVFMLKRYIRVAKIELSSEQ